MNITSENLQIMASISHEIRNPVNAIIGISHLLQKEQSKEVWEELVETLVQTSEYLKELTNNILDFTKLQEGMVHRKPVAVDVRKQIPLALHAQAALAKAKGLDFVIDIGEDVPSEVLFDKVRGTQVLVNLVSNALKFTEKGQITLEVRVLDSTETEVTLIVAVRDTGTGIPEDKQKEIFEPFRQGGSNINFKHGGTGLGLSISAMLLSEVGAKVDLKSRPGEGSEFSFVITLEIPQKTGKENLTGRDYTSEEISRIGKLLLVDDNEINLLIAGRTLENLGFSHTVARNGLEAVKMVQENDFAAVLMDLNMPEMDGSKATRAIRRLEEEKFLHLPIIALSGSLGFSGMEEVRNAGFSDFLEKPYDPQDLLLKIMEAVTDGFPQEA